jgi:hypothetical protein
LKQSPVTDGVPTNENRIREEIKSRLNSRSTFYHFQKAFFSLLSKNVKIKIHKAIILCSLYGCQSWSLTLMEEYRLRVFENRVLWEIFGRIRDEVTGGGGEISAKLAAP